MREDSILEDLDRFLRDNWLECCGHLSAFSLKRYGDEIGMEKEIKDVFSPGVDLMYQYDFGSTTELSVKAVYICCGVMKEDVEVFIIVRNAQPIIPCDEYGENQSAVICTEFVWDDAGWLCDKCAQDQECDDEMFLPAVNSPRAGVCGYTGHGGDMVDDY